MKTPANRKMSAKAQKNPYQKLNKTQQEKDKKQQKKKENLRKRGGSVSGDTIT